ncbi:SDR family NAD(P)-dependent oxidoreductase [Leucobacter sp. W1153]|uniref:SDR family NAD(P)-dependent oxidoreductase n=1 Tax=Leucobacter sp. W1153 TaxID=3439064 RepID=UPI003F3EBCD4
MSASLVAAVGALSLATSSSDAPVPVPAPAPLSAPVAIVTGAASGIGLAIARRLIADGFRVGVCDLNPLLGELWANEADSQVLALVGDVADPDFRRSFVDEVARAFGGIDVVVNNAATGGAGHPIATLDLESLRSTLEVNLVALVGMTQLALPYLRRSSRARVINLGSLFASDPVPNGGDYTASKGAVQSLTRAMAVEFGAEGITCNAIAPGYILTPMHEAEVAAQAAARGIDLESRFAELRSEVPLGRHGTSEDVAGAAAWLASVDSAYVTGLTVTVNGGVRFA